MKPVALLFAAGAICLPLTHPFTREGAFFVTFAIVVAVAAVVAAALAAAAGTLALWKVPAGIAAGSLASEGGWIAHWLWSNGLPAAGSLPMGLRIALVEGAALSTTAGVVALLVFALVRRIDRSG